MKKKMVALLAGALLTAAMAGNAMAFFSDASGNSNMELIRVVYDTTTNTEVGTDLTAIDSTYKAAAGAASKTVGGGAQAFTLGMLGAASYGELKVAYFTKNQSTQEAWLSSSDPNGQKLQALKWNNGSASIAAVANYYKGLGGTTGTVIGSTTNLSSFYQKEDKVGVAPGTFNTFFAANVGSASLADLATVGYVDQYLYYFAGANTAATGVKVATIRTMADGSTQIINASTPDPTPTPVPPAFMLMGSGLLGLVGIRRKARK